MFIILKTDYFQMWVFFTRDLRISTAGKHIGILRIKHFYFKPRKTAISFTLLLFGHYRFCMDGHFKIKI